VLFLLAVGSASASSGAGHDPPFGLNAAPEPSPEHGAIAESVRFLILLQVNQGRTETLLLTREDLQARTTIEIDGYTTGILVLCAVEMTARADGRRMAPLRLDRDGAVWAQNLGSVAGHSHFTALGADLWTKPQDWGAAAQRGTGGRLPGGYSIFPDVAGDAVSPDRRFSISLETGGKRAQWIVRQSATSQVCAISAEFPLARVPVPVYHLGTRAPQSAGRAEDFDERLRAIGRGIAAVEAAFGSELVEDIALIDLDPMHNAVTCDGRRRIWFYLGALQRESLDELTRIAEHESLHILADRLGFSAATAVRELFADLKGFDELSIERFQVIAHGRTPIGRAGSRRPENPFFHFISESHFITGMKGGHPQANIEEFCASFLHSLLVFERFEEALSKPMRFEDPQPRLLRPEERQRIAGTYLKAIDVFAGAMAASRRKDAAPGLRQSVARLESCLMTVREAFERLPL
jgi:hypothetical protein